MPGVNTFPPNTDEPTIAEDLYLPVRRPKQDRRSKLMKSYEAAGGRIGGAMVVNACPTRGEPNGCRDVDLDAEGYCKHMIGTTLPDDPTHFHPVVNRVGRLSEFKYTDSNQTLPVLPTDELVRITTCCRVYRRESVKKSKKDKEPTE